MKNKLWIPIAAVSFLLGAGALVAQSISVPQVQSVNPGDLFPDVVGGAPTAQTYYASGTQMGTVGFSLAGGNPENLLIGGDFSTNLFQRGTSVSLASSTYYVAYGADRWFTWGGTSTPATMTQQTGAADIPIGASASYRINKGSLTGVLQICTSQVVESANSYRAQSQTLEFTFDALAGSTFSAASSNLAVYVSYGTGTDEGSTYMAYGLNAHGGAGTTAWAGQVNLGGTNGFLIPITTAWARYGVAVPIPATATEIGVSICYTPVGTGTATDWFEFAKAQLVVNPALTGLAGTAGAVVNASGVAGSSAAAPVKSFARRSQALETLLQQRYTYSFKEIDTTTSVQSTGGIATATTTCEISFPFPVTMFKAPTYTTALTASTFTIDGGNHATQALSTPYAATQGVNTVNNASVTFTTGATLTQYYPCMLVSTAAGTGKMLWSAEE